MTKRTGILSRVHDSEGGYALITALLVLSVLTILMAVTLSAGSSVDRMAERGTKWTRVLAVAESGLDDAVSSLSVSRTLVSNPCEIGTSAVCEEEWGEYQMDWSTSSDRLTTTIEAVGYYPSKTDPNAITRRLQAVYQPEPSFKFALFSASTLDLKNNSEIWGSVYGASSVVFDQNTQLCGSAVSPGSISGGGGGGAAVVRSGTVSGKACTTTNSDGDLWAGGDITASVSVAGDVTSSGVPTCAGRTVSGQTIVGEAFSCGAAIASSASVKHTAWESSPPDVEAVPTFTFTEGNYDAASLHCYGAGGSCDPADASLTQVTAYNAATGNGNIHEGTYVVWTSGTCLGGPDADVQITLPEPFTVSGNLTVITNGRIDFGNQAGVTYTGPALASGERVLVSFISLCGSSTDAACPENGGPTCSISAKNGLTLDPELAGLIYTTGPMSLKNNGVSSGAMYSGTLQVKNNIVTAYDPSIARILGFDEGFVRTSWRECRADSCT